MIHPKIFLMFTRVWLRAGQNIVHLRLRFDYSFKENSVETETLTSVP